jgi:putative PIN family toxin of toxin-antitoxin system
MIRVVLDTNVYVSAAISPRSTSMKLIEAAQRGEVMLIMCETLFVEVQETLEREKFRRWITLDEVADFLAAVALLVDWVEDRPPAEIPLVCDDPDDNFLIALCQDARTNVLVSGDRAVQRIVYPNVQPYSPADALELLAYRHEWGDGYILGNPGAAMLQVAAEGSTALINVFFAFSAVFEEAADDRELAEYALNWVAVPSAVQPFLDEFDRVREMLADRGVGTRPAFLSPEVAYLKLPPNPRTLDIEAVAGRRFGP